ncbi:nicotinate-nucleotide adenylyltransferase [Thiomicrospira sp. R3]|uniref:nicotinate-nucleotide adenylyltransferase n=1 Tax=Thiomicrospira sp. R3 TaxID=3035472 RepID=UPI00259B3C5A|nr:nicotinate-nucleotide adenylyltransferase [Thiomicrospira sp. R3]WFE68210.1 nicotinate-nucleotide adenylyltransferase [Thiomicrospira sp. R3]
MTLTRPGQEKKSRIGIYGGTFDPVHYGHLRPALDAMHQLGLSQVRFVPCYQPVHRDQPQGSSELRCQMLQAAIGSQPGFELERCEIDRQGPSYTVDTLRQLKTRFNDHGLVLLMGMDAFSKFLSWHDWQGILNLANIAVMHRPGEILPETEALSALLAQRLTSTLTASNGQIIEVEVTQLNVSSTRIRALVKKDEPIAFLTPAGVIDVIKQQQLYR